MGCLNTMFLIGVIAFWIGFSFYPLFFASGDRSYLIYGNMYYARTQNRFNQIFFKINGDPIEYNLLMDQKNYEVFQSNFSRTDNFKISAVKVFNHQFLVKGLESKDYALDPQGLNSYHQQLRITATLGILLCLFVFLWLYQEYTGYFKRMRWFRNAPKVPHN
jgi:hypothetical protein